VDARYAAQPLPHPPQDEPFDATKIVRPDRRLMWYYAIVALLTGPLAPIVILPLFFKYETLRYRFDSSGLSMSWGLLFRREVFLTYRRIQDIHLTRNILQRWMGLATVTIQTASGSTGPEMAIEGILAAEPLRDYLYGKMRGARDDHPRPDSEGLQTQPGEPVAAPAGGGDESLRLLTEIRDLLVQLASRRTEQ